APKEREQELRQAEEGSKPASETGRLHRKNHGKSALGKKVLIFYGEKRKSSLKFCRNKALKKQGVPTLLISERIIPGRKRFKLFIITTESLILAQDER